MLDLNNVTLSSLLLMNAQDSIELEQSDELKEDANQSDDTSIDPGAFFSLLAQVVPNVLPEESDSIGSELVNTIDETQSIKNNISQEVQVIDTVDSNVAVAWINSEYYQDEINLNHSEPIGAVLSNDEANFKIDENNIPKDATKDNKMIANDEKQSTLKVLDNSVDGLDIVQRNSSEQEMFTSPLKIIKEQNTLYNIQVKLNNELGLNSNTSEKININMGKEVNLNTNGFIETNEIPNQIFNIEDVNPSMNTELNQTQNNGFSVMSAGQEHKNNIYSIEERNYTVLEEDNSALNKIKSDIGTLSTSLIPKPSIGTSTFDDVQYDKQTISDSLAVSYISNNANNSTSILEENASLLSTPMQSLTISESIEDPQWAKQFSEHVIWLGQQGVKSAVIKIHPEDLGPLEINVEVMNDTASVNIISNSVQAREIIDSSLSLLQEMMIEQGLNLTEVNIDSSKDARQFNQQNNHSSDDVDFVTIEEELDPVSMKRAVIPQGIIDYFA